MTIVNPPAIPPLNLTGYPSAYYNYPTVQPFSFRSALTFQQKLEAIAAWIPAVLVPYLTDNFDTLGNSYTDQVNALAATVNTALATQATTVNDALTAQQQQVADNLAATLAQITAGQNSSLYDAQVKSALQVANSTALALLDGRYATPQNIADATAPLSANIAGNTSLIAAINTILNGRLDDAALQTEFGDAAIAGLMKSGTTAVGVSFRRRFGSYVDDYNPAADGISDDYTVIQQAVTAGAGGIVYFGVGRTYAISECVIVPANTTIDFRGATVKKQYKTGTNIYATFANAHPGATGYGSGAGNLTFKNGTISGDYSSATKIDVAIALLHADYVNVQNMTFTQGVQMGHYLDLGGCRFVEVEDCSFVGGNVNTGVEQKEAIQVDVATRDGSSNASGANAWPSTIYDGLPSRHINVHDNYFTTATIGGTAYPMPNPIGNHSAALTSDSGYYEDITFENNVCEGWTRVPAQGATLAYGWVHFRGTRGLKIIGNTFRDTGATGRTGYPTIINVTDAPQVTADTDTGSVGAPVTTLGTTRYGYDTWITNNVFLALNNTPNTQGQGHVNVINTVNCTIRDNGFEVIVAPAIQVVNESTVDDLTIESNRVRQGNTSFAGDMILVKNTVASSISLNRIHMGATSCNGIHDTSGDSNLIANNTINGGASAIIVDSCTNDAVQNNTMRNPTAFGIKVGPSAGTSTADTLVSGNRVKTTTSGAFGFQNGSQALRTRQYGNHWNAPNPVQDTGASTVASAWSS